MKQVRGMRVLEEADCTAQTHENARPPPSIASGACGGEACGPVDAKIPRDVGATSGRRGATPGRRFAPTAAKSAAPPVQL